MSQAPKLSLFHRLRGRIWHLYFRIARPVTLGVQGVIVDQQNGVFLVRHSYVPGWHFPGGGVEAGETVLEALAREMREEGNLEITAPPRLHGVFFNNLYSRRDHVVVYVVPGFRQTAPRPPDAEIVECGFFPLHALPEATTRAVRARLAEVYGGVAVPEIW